LCEVDDSEGNGRTADTGTNISVQGAKNIPCVLRLAGAFIRASVIENVARAVVLGVT